MGRKSRKRKNPTPHDEKTDADIAEGKVVAITREQALIGLIETAIRLLVDGKDIGSIHVLTFAAWKVLRDLGAKDGKGPTTHTDPRVEDWLFDGYDFFRHASPKFREAQVIMPVMINEIILFDAVVSFTKQFSKRTPLMTTFILWFAIDYRSHSEVLKDILDETLPSKITAETLGKLSRVEFFELCLPQIEAHSQTPP